MTVRVDVDDDDGGAGPGFRMTAAGRLSMVASVVAAARVWSLVCALSWS
ncbi:hypothetical protein [Arthrobacter pigmenti]